MKLFILLAFLSCVAFAEHIAGDYYNECITTRQGFDSYHQNGNRVVTFGLSWCKKSWRSKFAVIDHFNQCKNCKNWTYHYLNCNKFAEGTCKGLFLNFLDYAPKKNKFMDYRTPRTFCIKKSGGTVKVLPITDSGRLHSSERNSQKYFEDWMKKCNDM